MTPIAVLVELPQDGGVRMAGNLAGDPMQVVTIGDEVEGVLERHSQSDPPFSLLQWRALNERSPSASMRVTAPIRRGGQAGARSHLLRISVGMHHQSLLAQRCKHRSSRSCTSAIDRGQCTASDLAIHC